MAAPLAVPLLRDAKPPTLSPDQLESMSDALLKAAQKAANPPVLYGGAAGGDMGRAGKVLAFDADGFIMARHEALLPRQT